MADESPPPSPPRTPPPTTIHTRIKEIDDDLAHNQIVLANITRNISQVLQSQSHFNDRFEQENLRYLVKKEKEFTHELSNLIKRKRGILDKKINTKKRRFASMPIVRPSRVRSLSHSRSNKNKKVQLLRSSSLGGTKKKRRTRTRK